MTSYKTVKRMRNVKLRDNYLDKHRKERSYINNHQRSEGTNGDFILLLLVLQKYDKLSYDISATVSI